MASNLPVEGAEMIARVIATVKSPTPVRSTLVFRGDIDYADVELEITSDGLTGWVTFRGLPHERALELFKMHGRLSVAVILEPPRSEAD